MPDRPLHVRLMWMSRDYAKRVWDNSGEDNIFFLAGGIAFNILLAIVPFLLLVVSGLGYFLNQSTDISTNQIVAYIDRLLPVNTGGATDKLLREIIRTRATIGLYSAIGFIWFSTRLFGSLRSVLADVFDVDQDRGIIQGKLFDIKLTVYSSVLVIIYTALTAYLETATTSGVSFLASIGIRRDVMAEGEYLFGRFLAFSVVTLIFFSLYKFLPNRRIRPKTALVAAIATAVLFEIAKIGFAVYSRSFNPGSYYSGTLSAMVVLVVWVYYAALIFILGGEIAQVYELRLVRRRQREAFE